MTPIETHRLLTEISGLRTELAELAFQLDRRECCEQADTVAAISARLGMLAGELENAAVGVSGNAGLVR